MIPTELTEQSSSLSSLDDTTSLLDDVAAADTDGWLLVDDEGTVGGSISIDVDDVAVAVAGAEGWLLVDDEGRVAVVWETLCADTSDGCSVAVGNNETRCCCCCASANGEDDVVAA